jgi:hypothetical protein
MLIYTVHSGSDPSGSYTFAHLYLLLFVSTLKSASRNATMTKAVYVQFIGTCPVIQDVQ